MLDGVYIRALRQLIYNSISTTLSIVSYCAPRIYGVSFEKRHLFINTRCVFGKGVVGKANNQASG